VSSPTGAVFLSYASEDSEAAARIAQALGAADIQVWFDRSALRLAVDRSYLIASDRTFLLPLVVDDSRESDARVPDRFREVQWTMLSRDEVVGEFVDRVARLLASDGLPGRRTAALPLMQALDSNKAFGDTPAHALFHLLCGDVDQGADWTERAIEERDLAILVYLRFALGKDLSASHRWPRIATMLNLHALPQQPGS
jgi:hypothetical protein